MKSEPNNGIKIDWLFHRIFRSDFAQKLRPISLMEKKTFVQLKLFLDETRQQTR